MSQDRCLARLRSAARAVEAPVFRRPGPARCLQHRQPQKVHRAVAGTAACRLRAEYSPARPIEH
eukprot:168137-Chlamydomonas_euryale.AAC.9